jgi:histidyl-tRNA synthetase
MQTELAVSLDKLNKIGPEKVLQELASKGFENHQLTKLEPLLQWQGTWEQLKEPLTSFLEDSNSGKKGISDIEAILQHVNDMGHTNSPIILNVCLARGLAYYTGSIFEVIVNNVQIGSLGGGGRYDDLTGVFGLPDVSGVGISFGVDRIYDVMEQLELFPEEKLSFSDVLLVALDGESEHYALAVLSKLRKNGVASELYPDRSKLKKPLNYANKKGVPMVVLIGPDEISSGKLTVKHMAEGTQEPLTEEQLVDLLKNQGH